MLLAGYELAAVAPTCRSNVTRACVDKEEMCTISCRKYDDKERESAVNSMITLQPVGSTDGAMNVAKTLECRNIVLSSTSPV